MDFPGYLWCARIVKHFLFAEREREHHLVEWIPTITIELEHILLEKLLSHLWHLISTRSTYLHIYLLLYSFWNIIRACFGVDSTHTFFLYVLLNEGVRSIVNMCSCHEFGRFLWISVILLDVWSSNNIRCICVFIPTPNPYFLSLHIFLVTCVIWSGFFFSFIITYYSLFLHFFNKNVLEVYRTEKYFNFLC